MGFGLELQGLLAVSLLIAFQRSDVKTIDLALRTCRSNRATNNKSDDSPKYMVGLLSPFISLTTDHSCQLQLIHWSRAEILASCLCLEKEATNGNSALEIPGTLKNLKRPERGIPARRCPDLSSNR
jgi:hypothetical protein